MRARLVGLHKATKKLARGGVAVYAYACRGGALIARGQGRTLQDANADLEKALGRQAALDKLEASRQPIRRIDDRAYVRGLIYAFKASPQFDKLAASTQAAYEKYLGDFDAEFGTYKVRVVEKATTDILDWRDDNYADTPRAADYRTAAVSRLFSWVKARKLASDNPMDGIERLYTADRSDIIWTDADLTKVCAVASKELQWAIRLAAEIGLRTGDLLRLTWNEIGENGIVLNTSKRQRLGIIPLTDNARSILGRIPRKGPVVLTSTKGVPWTESGFKTVFRKAKAKAKTGDLHFHDLRGTAVTRIYLTGLDAAGIATIFAWSVQRVENILRKYVSGDAVALDLLARMNQKPRPTNRPQTGSVESA